jgi:hypothetical protein
MEVTEVESLDAFNDLSTSKRFHRAVWNFLD